MADNGRLDIRWCADPDIAPELGAFFASNITPEYISHSELQGPRALDVGKWRPGIETIFADEIKGRVARERGLVAHSGASYPILEARQDGRLVGIAFVSLLLDAPIPYAILEDVVVDSGLRGQGIGRKIIEWVCAAAREHGCKRVFLESGQNNHHAHDLFEREGFRTTSIVMMKTL